MPEWLNGVVSKTTISERVSEVRILPSPFITMSIFNLSEKQKDPQNFKEVLSQLKILNEEFKKVSEELEKLKKDSFFNVQKIGMIRFSPFKEVGGDQSFSVALLDGNNDGIVITSLYTREDNRIYGKPIKASQSEYLLSDEEKQAIEKAKNCKVQAKNSK